MFRKSLLIAIASLIFTFISTAGLIAQTINSLNDVASIAQTAEEDFQAGRVPEAIETTEKLIQWIANNRPDARDWHLYTSLNLGRYYVAEGATEEGIKLMYAVWEELEDTYGQNNERTISVASRLAGAHERSSRFGEAEYFHIEALTGEEMRSGSESIESVLYRNNYALLLDSLGKRSQAIFLHRQNLEIRLAALGVNNERTLHSRRMLAQSLSWDEQHNEAVALFQENMNVLEAADEGDTLNYIAAIDLLSWAIGRSGDVSNALELSTDAQSLREVVLGQDHDDSNWYRSDLADRLMLNGQIVEAEELFQITLQNQEASLGPEHPVTLYSLERLAMSRARQGETTEAIETLLAILPEYQRVYEVDHVRLTELYENLSIAFALDGRTETRARSVEFAELLLRQRTASLYERLSTSQSDEARLAAAEQVPADIRSFAIGISEYGFDELAADSLLLTKGVGEEFYASLLRPELADDRSRRALSRFLDAESSLLAAKANELESITIANATASRDLALRELLQERGALEQANSIVGLSSSDVLDVLPDDAVFLDFGVYSHLDVATGKVGQDRLYVATYSALGGVEGRDLGSMAELSDDLRVMASIQNLELLKVCAGSPDEGGCPSQSILTEISELVPAGSNADQTINAARNRLSAVLLQTVEGISSDVKIIISPDGMLHRLNFNLLGWFGETLLESHEVAVIPNGQAFFQVGATNAKVAEVDFFAVGGVDYGSSSNGDTPCVLRSLGVGEFCPLENSAEEVSNISKIFESAEYTAPIPLYGLDALEPAVVSNIGQSRVVHLATHATNSIFDGRATLDGVALALSGANLPRLDRLEPENDGLLFGSEIIGLDLSSTELVTLSACSTIDGNPAAQDGFYSLSSAFRIAGAQNVLSSLWVLEDESTSKFMQIFYENWLRLSSTNPTLPVNVTLRNALRETQLEAKQDSLFSEGDWAAFVLLENQI